MHTYYNLQLELAMLEETRRLEDKAKEEKLKQVSRCSL
jgi:hypothetical protein